MKKLTRKAKTESINHWNEATFINKHKTKNTIIEVHFKDKGQDFLRWLIDGDTGKVIHCQPYQANIWCKFYVNEPRSLKVGDRLQISETPIDPTNLLQEFRSINYPILKVTSI